MFLGFKPTFTTDINADHFIPWTSAAYKVIQPIQSMQIIKDYH